MKGFQKKKQKLSCELKELSSQDKPPTVTSNCNDVSDIAETGETAAVAESLSDTLSIHSTLMKIFCPKSVETAPKSVETASRFNPSFVSQQLKTVKKNTRKTSAVTPKSKVSPVGLSGKSDKPVTVTLINSDDVYTLPKEKEKKQLRKERKMGFCTFSESDSSDEVQKKIREAIPCCKAKK